MKLSTLRTGRGLITESVEPRFDANYDLIVAGLGSAGSLALVAGARQGITALGIDKLCLMGGSGTAGGISSYYYGVPGGLYEAIDERARNLAEECFPPCGKLHPEARHLALEEAALEAGAELAYTSRIVGVFMEDKRVCGIRWISPQGIRDTACRMLIDATGDGEVCALAGCSFEYGREYDGIPQPYSHVPCWILEGKRHAAQNFDAASTVSAIDGAEYSEGIVHGGTFHLRDQYSETEKLLFAGRLPGLREGRLIHGETTLRFSDYISGNVSDRPVFHEYANLDTHTQDWAFESVAVQEWLTVCSFWGLNFGVPVPLEAMIPKGFDGIMTAGRCLAVDHDLSQAVRMQRAMQQCGEAVATATALALRKNIPLRELSYEELALELRQSGCLPESPPATFTEQLPDDMDSIRAGLASDEPGKAIWAARLQGDAIRSALHDWLAEPDSHLARNAALALGLLDDPACLPVLRRIIAERDPYIPQSGRKRNARRLCAALYLAGRMADPSIIDDAAALVADPENEFDVFSYAFTALLRIGDAHPETRSAIATILRSVLEAADFQRPLSKHRARFSEPSEAYFRIAAARELDRWKLPHALMERVAPERLTMRERGLYRKR